MGNKFMSARTEIESLLEQKEKIILKASDQCAAVMLSMNDNGESNITKIQKDLEKLLNGFNPEEINKILIRAVAKVIVTL